MKKIILAVAIPLLITACAGSNLGECCCAQYVIDNNNLFRTEKMLAAQCADLENTGNKMMRGVCVDAARCT